MLTKDTDPDTAPVTSGVNTIVTCADAPAVIVSGKLKLGALKSEPVKFAAVTVTDELPVLFNVVLRLDVLPIVVLENVKLEDDALNRYVGTAVAVPVNVTADTVLEALLATVTDPE